MTDVPVGIRTSAGTVYAEIAIRREDIMNEAVRVGEVFKLAELVPYQEGKIVNMDLLHNDKMKFVVMAFDSTVATLPGTPILSRRKSIIR